MLNLAIVWAAKQNTDKLIECALNKVDLHYMEQNDAPRIVELVAQNDIETAMERIEAFGGNDKQGLQRKFTLYMLCLMEVTLLESNDKPFRRAAIEKLLSHLDENIPVEHSILNWNEFFPSYLIFTMACEWAEMGLDYLRVYKRTDNWESDWIAEKAPYSFNQYQILQKCAKCIIDDWDRSDIYKSISKQLAKQGEFNEALACTQLININLRKSQAFNEMSNEFSQQGKLEEAEYLMLKAIEYARNIDNEIYKSQALNAIVSLFYSPTLKVTIL
jgi:tetratricopeptide (TPR) repeat protein